MSRDVVRSGSLRWAAKPNLLRSVADRRDSQFDVGEGAAMGSQGDLVYPLDDARDFDPVTREGLLVFRGAVALRTRLGMLPVRLADPWIDVAGDRGVLSVSAAHSRPDGRRGHVPIVEFLRRPGTDDMVVGAQVRLTHAGVAFFEGAFPAGEPFADLYVAEATCVGDPTGAGAAVLSASR